MWSARQLDEQAKARESEKKAKMEQAASVKPTRPPLDAWGVFTGVFWAIIAASTVMGLVALMFR